MRGRRKGNDRRTEVHRKGGTLDVALLLVAIGSVALTGYIVIPAPAAALTPHAPIVIVGNADFTPANGVTGGSGTASDPYVIEGWEIDGSANSGIEVSNTDAHFVIRNVYVHSSLVDAIFLYDVRNARVENATVSGNDAGIYIQVSSNITVAWNNVSSNNLDAIILDWSSNVTLEGNEMWNNGDWGVFAYESDGLVLRNNNISNNGVAGVELHSSDRMVVEGNTVAGNPRGLVANQTSNVTVVGNGFSGNGFGFNLVYSVDVLVRNNTVGTSPVAGIGISGGARVTIEENNITGNGVGVGANGVTSLLVRHNQLFANLQQAADDAGGANAWDDGYPSGGNFWSDYAGVDDCSGPNQDVCPIPDGIGDTPYVIDADSRDRYPLMVPGGVGQPGYTVRFIPPLPGDLYTIPWGVNATGAVVGWSTDGSVERPFLYTDATGTVPLPVGAGRVRGTARDINAAGTSVGGLYSPDPAHAVRWPSGTPAQDLGVLGTGPTSEAWGVNGTGAVVGVSDYGGPLPHGFLYTDAGGMIDVTPSAAGHAYDVNDAGVVVGRAGGRAFRWAGGVLEDLGVAGGFAFSTGQAINEARQVAGCLTSATGNSQRVARYTDGVGWEILGGAGETNCAWGINAYGDVVGNGRPTGTGIVRAFLYTDPGGMQDLERMIDPGLMLRLLDATDINDAGHIVGYAWDNTIGQNRGFRLDPTAAPSRMVIGTSPAGLQVRVDGVDRTTPYSFYCVPGSAHTVEALSPQGTGPGVRQVFVDWSDGGAQAHGIVCEPGQTITANYETQFWLAMDATAGGVSLIPGSSWRDAGAAVTIECVMPPAGADTRFWFRGWIGTGAGSYTGTLNPAGIVMAGPIQEVCDAVQEFRLAFDTNPTGLMIDFDGVLTATPFIIWCVEGSVHSAAAPSPIPGGPDRRLVFLRWSDGDLNAFRTIRCDAPGTYVAEYGVEYLLTFDTSPTGLTVVVDGVPNATPYQLWRLNGSSLSIGTDSPQYLGPDRYDFDRWSDSGAQNHSITIGAPATYVAYFLGPSSGAPSVTLLSPIGGEVWTGGSAHPISWTMDDDSDAVLRVDIYLTTDGGATYTLLHSGMHSIGPNVLSWTLPLVNTISARVRVCATDSGALTSCDTSGNFAIDSLMPIVVAIQPPADAVAVDPNAPIVVTFSEAMNRAATEAAFSLVPSPGALAFAWDDANVTLTVQHAPLSTGTVHTVTIGCGAFDASDPGNPLSGCPWSSSFTTRVPPIPPQVTIAIPSGGEVWTGATPHAIEWVMVDPDSGDLSVTIDYSPDGGATWSPVLDSVLRPQGANAHPWLVPRIDATAVVVRVCASDGALSACDASPPFSIDSTPPAVAFVSPPDGAVNVPVGEPIVVTFSEAMNAATFPMPGISLAPAVTGLVATWSGGGRTATFAHSPFAPCTAYMATVDPGGWDLSDPGNALGVPRTWSFATVCPPNVELLEPTGGELWTGGTVHAIRFRASDEADDVVRAWVNATVDGVSSTLYADFVSVGDTSLFWTVPSSTASVRVAVTAVDGTNLGTTATSGPFALDATAPTVVATDPARGATDVAVQPAIVLTFSERMNPDAVQAALAMAPPASGVGYAWDASGRVLTVTFASALSEYTDYALTVGCGALDASDPGNALEGCPDSGYRLSFRTEIVAPPPVASAVVSGDPRAGVPVTFDGRGSSGEIATWTWTVRSGSGAIVATLEGPVASHTFAEGGTYGVTLQVTDTYGRSDQYSFGVTVRGGFGGDGSPWVLAALTAAVLAAILFAASEPGRVALVTATAGRAYGRRPKDEKDSEIRGAILYYLRVHPGDTYTDIKRNLDLNDGVVTYHLARLERDGLIRSAIRGARKRYYPVGVQIPLENGGELHEIQRRLLDLVAREPGMPLAVLAEHLGVSSQLALYHLRKLAQADRVGLERRGLRLRAFPVPRER